MDLRFYLDEDVDPLLAQVLRDRNVDCISTYEVKNQGLSDQDQLVFALRNKRTIISFNVKDFVFLAKQFAREGKSHNGIIVSDHLPFRGLLRRILSLMSKIDQDNLTNKFIWLQDYKKSEIP
ncbi:MAG: DUF5615 family PIN-like protein [Nitrospirae bacterium]|nr:DUF5615 family PIN-like protein [Nitrospirota bacterium]